MKSAVCEFLVQKHTQAADWYASATQHISRHSEHQQQQLHVKLSNTIQAKSTALEWNMLTYMHRPFSNIKDMAMHLFMWFVFVHCTLISIVEGENLYMYALGFTLHFTIFLSYCDDYC